MKALLKSKLLSNTLIFTISTFLNKGLNFFILPVLTYYLTRDDYGHLGFIVSVVAIASIYIGLWPGNFLMAKFSSYGKERMQGYLFNIFVITGITFFVVLVFLLLMKDILFVNFHNPVSLIFLISF